MHECLASGLPALAFDLGAQGDAVRAAPTGILLPWAADRRRADQLARLIIDAFENETHREEVAASPQGAFFHRFTHDAAASDWPRACRPAVAPTSLDREHADRIRSFMILKCPRTGARSSAAPASRRRVERA